jgi:hypothetical protein
MAPFIQHHCTRTASGSWCCQSLKVSEEKYTVAAINLLVGITDPIPCESRWTHLLPSFKRTLVRRLLNNFTGEVFQGLSGGSTINGAGADGEAEATSEFLKELNGKLITRAQAYYADERAMHELAMLTVVLDHTDVLLYELLGGTDRSKPPCKVGGFLDRDESIVAKTMAGYFSLINSQ